MNLHTATPRQWSGLEVHLRRSLIHPIDAIRLDIEGVVHAEFVVGPSGTLSNMRTIQELGAACNTEAFRLTHTFDRVAAIHQGRRVRTALRVRLRFNPAR
jgi:protein TonB